MLLAFVHFLFLLQFIVSSIVCLEEKMGKVKKINKRTFTSINHSCKIIGSGLSFSKIGQHLLKLIISNSTLIIRTPSHCHKFPQALSHFVGSSPSWGDLIFWNLILNGLFHIFLYIRKSFNKPQMSRQLQNS